jgi:hypothetical protein
MSSVPEAELLSVSESESDLSFFRLPSFVASSDPTLLFLVLLGLDSLDFWVGFLRSLSGRLLGDFRPLLDRVIVELVVLLQLVMVVAVAGVISRSGLLTSFCFPLVDDVLLLRRVRILCLEGVVSSSSGTGLNRNWLGLTLGGGDSTPDSSPYFL